MDFLKCGNLAIFLLLWFYFKSILPDFRRPKTDVLTILKTLKLIFGKISHLEMSKIPKNSKFKIAQMVKMAVFGASKWPKLISRKVWMAKNSEISTIPIRLPGLYLTQQQHQKIICLFYWSAKKFQLGRNWNIFPFPNERSSVSALMTDDNLDSEIEWNVLFKISLGHFSWLRESLKMFEVKAWEEKCVNSTKPS